VRPRLPRRLAKAGHACALPHRDVCWHALQQQPSSPPPPPPPPGIIPQVARHIFALAQAVTDNLKPGESISGLAMPPHLCRWEGTVPSGQGGARVYTPT